MEKFLKFVGGKRGLSVIISTGVLIATQLGWITPHVAEAVGGVASALGIAGIAHNISKTSE